MSQAFPSKYLKAADLNKQQWTVTIARVVQEEGIDKPIVYFQEAQKGMALNKTNGMMIAAAYGDDTDHWVGRKIKLYEASVSFNGQFVPAIRIMTVGPEPQQGAQLGGAPDPNAPPSPSPVPGGSGAVPGQDLDDVIPF